MRVRIVQTDIFTANPEINIERISTHLNFLDLRENDVLLFPANSLCGSFLYNSIKYNNLKTELDQFVDNCIELPAKNPFIIGSLTLNEDNKLQNTLIFIENNRVIARITKQKLSIEEKKYCVEGTGVQIISYKDKLMAIGFTEDYRAFSYNKNHKAVDYTFCFSSEIFSGIHSIAKRNHSLNELSKKTSSTIIYINRVGYSTPYVHTGGSFVHDNFKATWHEFPLFQEHFETIDLDNFPSKRKDKLSQISLYHEALVTSIGNYFAKNKFQKAILGLSGGIDSALVAALAVEALGKSNVKGILMPSEFSSQHSIDDAVALANNLEIEYDIVPIKNLFSLMNETMLPVFKETSFDVTEENIQARLRGIILMATSNKTGAILLNTTNKSEMAVGYGTLYGDMCGALSPLGDLYKTDVFELSRWINRNKEIIPKNTIQKLPSAELRPNQLDSDSLPDYDILDKILYAFIEEEKSNDEIYALGFDKAVVDRIITLVKRSEFKRRQAASVIKLSPKAFGVDVLFPLS